VWDKGVREAVPMEWVAVGLVLVALGVFALRAGKRGGLRGLAFGAPVVETLGEVDLDERGWMRMRLRVNLLEQEAESGNVVGIEILTCQTARFDRSYEMIPLVLDRQQTRGLIRLLEEAASKEFM